MSQTHAQWKIVQPEDIYRNGYYQLNTWYQLIMKMANFKENFGKHKYDIISFARYDGKIEP